MDTGAALSVVDWIYLISVVIIIGTMLLRTNVVVPAVIGTFLVVTVMTGNPITGFIGIFDASFVAAKQLFDIFLVITFMTALLGALKVIGADVLMVTPLRHVMRNSVSSYIVIAIATYLISLFFWPTPAVPLVAAVLLPAAIAAGLPPLVGAMVIAIAGQGMALSSDYVIRVAPGISAKAAGSPDLVGAIANQALILSLITGGIALLLTFIFSYKEFKRPDYSLLQKWYNRAGSGDGSRSHSGTFDKSEMSEVSKRSDEEAKALEEDLEDPTRVDERGHSRWGHVFAIATPLVFLALIIIMALPAFVPGIAKLRGGDAAGLVGGVGFALMMVVVLVSAGPRKMVEECPEHMIDGFVFAFKAMGYVLPIAGFFFLGTSHTASHIIGMPENQTPGLLFELARAGQQLIPHNHFTMAFGVLIIGMITGIDGSGFSGLPLTGALAGTFGPLIGMHTATLAAVGQMGSIWTGGGTLIAWSSLIAVAGFARVSVLDLVRRLALPVLIGMAVSTVVAVVYLG